MPENVRQRTVARENWFFRCRPENCSGAKKTQIGDPTEEPRLTAPGLAKLSWAERATYVFDTTPGFVSSWLRTTLTFTMLLFFNLFLVQVIKN